MRSRTVFIFGLFLVVASLFVFPRDESTTLAQSNPAIEIREVRTFDNDDVELANPVSLAYAPDSNSFLVIDVPVIGIPKVVELSPAAERLASMPLRVRLADYNSATFDSLNNTLLLLDLARSELVGVETAVLSPTRLGVPAITRTKLPDLGVTSVGGMAFDPQTKQLFILDAAKSQLVSVSPDDQLPPQRYQISANTDGRALPAGLRGLALDPNSGHFYFISSSEERAYEITATGQIIATYDLKPFGLVNPQNLVIAPSGDFTDDPGVMSLYLVDGPPLPDAATDRTTTTRTTGQIIELILAPSRQQAVPVSSENISVNAVSTDNATLVRLTQLSQFSPPSPDTAGIAYLPNSNTLLISDSEVNEIPNLFTGKNLFESTLSGALIRTYTSLPFSDEPTGVAYNPVNRHLYISDDTGSRGVYIVNPGPDGAYNTSDDVISQFATGPFNGSDPEGVAYDSWYGNLIVVDGLNEEVYVISPGADGLFTGVSPAGDDQMTHFDVTSMGIRDPEGVEFNPDNGHLYILSSRDGVIAETTLNGTLLRYIDFSSLNIEKAAGLAYAPSSFNPANKHLYIVDRGLDNNNVPSENDGRLYEISFSANVPPVVNAGPDQTIQIPNSATLTGVVTDDGQPSPPGSVSVAWSQISGPGIATFANATSAQTTATFSSFGYYTLRLTANDGATTSSDDVIITALGTNNEVTLERRVGSSADDAEESAAGTVSVNNSDLEMVFDGGNQTVGLRFTNITVPRGANILNAYVQFKTDEANSVATNLTIQAQAIDNAPTFTTSVGSISSRARTGTAVTWIPSPWTVIGEIGLNQRTTNIAPVIQEIVNRSGWSSGNAFALIITGAGERVAESFNGDQLGAPLLHLEYTTTGGGPTSTSTPTPTSTAIGPTSTPTPTATATNTPTPTATATNTPAPIPGVPNLRIGVLTNVSSNWTTVTLDQTYNSMVVVASPNYTNSNLPAVVRIRNVSGNSFDIRVQNPSNSPLNGYTVHYMVVEEGIYNTAQHGIKMEAVKYVSSTTGRFGFWVGEQRSYNNAYTSPVVLGQVMTANDANWSTFWSYGPSRKDPPNNASLYVGKHVGEDPNIVRANETIGYIVLEAGAGAINGVNYIANLGTDTIKGMDNSPPFTYTLTGLSSASVGITSMSAMDGDNGGWALLYGTNSVTTTALRLAIDEDQVADAERDRTNEQVAYIVFR